LVALDQVNPKVKLFIGLMCMNFVYQMMRRDVESFDWLQMGIMSAIAAVVCLLIPLKAFKKRRGKK